jgi:subtilisin family serine protease
MEELDFSAYDEVTHFANGLATVKKAGKYGFADYTGRLVIDAVYDDIFNIGSNNGASAVKRNGKWGVIDNKGGIMVPLEFEIINSYGPFCIISNEDKMGIITRNGEEKLAPVYDDIDDLRYMRYKGEQPGLFKIQQNGKWGVLNKKLELVVAPVYDEIIGNNAIWLDDKILHVKKGDSRYLVTINGEEIMPFDDDIMGLRYQSWGLIVFTKQDKLYQADLYGNVMPCEGLGCE